MIRKLLAVMCGLALASSVHAVTLTNNQVVSLGVINGTGGPITNGVGISGSNTFYWADSYGDGSMVPATTGLNLSNKTFNAAGTKYPYTLDLWDGTSNGNITWGNVSNGKIQNLPVTNYAAYAINITNACDISVSAIEAYGQTYSGGADVTVDQTGNMNVAGQVKSSGTAYGSGGWIKLTGGGITAGTLIAGSIVSGNNRAPNFIQVQSYRGVTITGTGGLDSHETGVLVGDSNTNRTISVTDIGTGGIIVTGQINSSRITYRGPVTLSSYGAIAISNVNASATTPFGQSDGGDITITAGSHITAIGTLDSSLSVGTSYARSGGNITIMSSNGAVSLASLTAANNCVFNTVKAGDISITSYGDLTITGTLTAKMTGYPTATNKYGFLNLISTGPGSKITVGNLNLTSFRTNAANTFDAAGSNSYITGIISNYTSKGTNSLRLAAGQIVWYNATLAGNAYLNAADYVMVGGGTLMHSGTVSSTRTTLPEFVNQLGYDNQL